MFEQKAAHGAPPLADALRVIIPLERPAVDMVVHDDRDE
jgi:hypothetical protein